MIEPFNITFEGAEVLLPSGVVHAPLSIADGFVSTQGTRTVDATGFLILPGIVDLHGDGFERHLAPRRGVVHGTSDGLPALEAELAANGITTSMLAQFLSWEGGMRGPEFAEKLAMGLSQYQAQLDLRLQLRLEISLTEEFDRLKRLVDTYSVDLVVLNDHLPHKELSKGKRPPALIGQALKAGRAPEAHAALLQRLYEGLPDAKEALQPLLNALLAKGVRIGSHDDASPDERLAFRALGADIAEFPETIEAARAAKDAGEPVIMGAPNVVRGQSHKGNVGAASLIEDGLVDALVSDYHYPSPHRAAFCLADGGMPLAQAWSLISSGPSKVMGWHDRGDLEVGRRADIVVVNPATRRVEATFCFGRLVHLSGHFASRLIV